MALRRTTQCYNFSRSTLAVQVSANISRYADPIKKVGQHAGNSEFTLSPVGEIWQDMLKSRCVKIRQETSPLGGKAKSENVLAVRVRAVNPLIYSWEILHGAGQNAERKSLGREQTLL